MALTIAADIDQDGTVAAADLDAFCQVYRSDSAMRDRLDLNGDSTVTLDDLYSLVAEIGTRVGDVNLTELHGGGSDRDFRERTVRIESGCPLVDGRRKLRWSIRLVGPRNRLAIRGVGSSSAAIAAQPQVIPEVRASIADRALLSLELRSPSNEPADLDEAFFERQTWDRRAVAAVMDQLRDAEGAPMDHS